jgi:peroxiredoxin Q/BCP
MVSVDDAETNKRFAEEHDADFPILSDPNRTVAPAYGVLNSRTPPRANRWTFYIGPDGKILYIDKDVRTGNAGEDMITRLEALGVKKK